MKANKKTQVPEELKALAVSYKKIFLDENGKMCGDGEKVIKDLIRYSRMYQTSDGLSDQEIIRHKARADVVIYIMDSVFSSLDYYDNLARMTIENEQREDL